MDSISPGSSVEQASNPAGELANSPLRSARWIWAAQTRHEKDRYACFRHRFQVAKADDGAFIDVSADSDFVVWLNGREVGRGQFGDFAKAKTWSRFPVGDDLIEGENLLTVWAFHRGEDFFEHQAGPGGIILGLQAADEVVVSDEQWRAIEDPAFASRQNKMTFQVGYTFEYDAARSLPWREAEFDDSGWPRAAVVQSSALGAHWHSLSPRPLPSQVLHPLSPGTISSQGLFFEQAPRDESPAMAMAADALRAERPWIAFSGSWPKTAGDCTGRPVLNIAQPGLEPLVLNAPTEGASGRYFIIELTNEIAGLLAFEIEARAGTVIDIGHGEHLDDGRVRVAVSSYRFADRYICAEGRQQFEMPFRRIGARYLEIHCKGELKIYSFGLRSSEYPVPSRGELTVEDPLITQVRQMAVRTMGLCKHDHYEDCPWREQALYGLDARLQALFDYSLTDDYLFAETSLRLLGKSLKADGFFDLTAPAVFPTTIPTFTFNWIPAVQEHWLYSGSPVLFQEFHPTIEAILDSAFRRGDEGGLYIHPTGERYWHFYEWTRGSGGYLKGDVRHVLYNLYLLEAIQAAEWMYRRTGREERADVLADKAAALKAAINHFFWDEELGGYQTERLVDGRGKGAHELAQALALGEGVVEEDRIARVVETILAGDLVPTMLGAQYYLLRAMHRHSPYTRRWIAERLERTWSKMAFAGANTMWEMIDGGAEFEQAASLCHAFSCLPLHYQQTALLGIAPLTPGFKTFALRVYPYRLSQAEGKVPTPFGAITVAWHQQSEGLVINAQGPSECTPVLDFHPEFPVLRASYNGAPLRITRAEPADELELVLR